MINRLMNVAVALCLAFMVQTPIVSNLPAFADSPPALNKDTDPKILRKYVEKLSLQISRRPTVSNLMSKGQCLEWLKNYSEAVVCFLRASKLDTDNANAYLGCARNYRFMGNYKKAEHFYTKSIRYGKRTAEVFAGRALANTGMKSYRKAISDAKTAISIDGSDNGAWYAKGYSELKLGNANESILSFSEAIKLKPRDASLYALRSNAYKKIGDRKKAEKDFELYRRYSGKL